MRTAAIIFLVIALLAGCAKQNDKPAEQNKQTGVKIAYTTIFANGYGESKEIAIEDAKNDALRQFGFNLVSKEGKPELIYAGKIVDYKVVDDYSENVKNGTWHEIKIQAEIQKL